MAATYEPIYTTTLGSNQTSVSLSSFGGYTDLILIVNGKTDTNTANISLQFNSDTGNNYSYMTMQGDGSSASAAGYSPLDRAIIGNLGNPNFGTLIAQIFDYTNTSTYKTLLTRNNSTDARVQLSCNAWRSTSAITSATLVMQSGYYLLSGSTITLYGIKAA